MDLIPIVTGPLGDGIQTTDARNLHGFLDVGRIFAAWIQDRIAEYKFVEGRDYVVLSESGNNPQGGRPSKEYAITLGMAKELAMVERTAKGREARQYFIECERKLLDAPRFDPASLSRMDILKMALDSEQRAIQFEAERDHAIATKAQIGSKREATAMANVAKANKEVARLKDQLGFSVRQATILQVEDATGQDFDFLPMRRWCQANEVVAESVPDKRYPKGVKAWPAAAWKACYGVDLQTHFNQ